MKRLGPGDPRQIGAYRLLGRLGAGGMGQVFLARSDRGRTVAVKLIRRELAEREEFRTRFRREVHAARQVGGHWTAPVLDADTEAPVPWVATGYVAGPSLQAVVDHDHGPLPERSVRILAAGLAGALKDIHAAGLVHRDLKPSNVLVTIDGPRVIDFGIARALESVSDTSLTRTGALVGSPGFMSPEQVNGERITPACDVFCLGSVLAFAASGRQPFGTADGAPHVLMFRIARDEPDLHGVPESLAELIAGCLRKDPAARPTLDAVLERTGAEDTVTDGRSRDPWLPGTLVAQLGRHAVRLLDTEDPGGAEGAPDVPPPPPASDARPTTGAPPPHPPSQPPRPQALQTAPPHPHPHPQARPPHGRTPPALPPAAPPGPYGYPHPQLPTMAAGRPPHPSASPPPPENRQTHEAQRTYQAQRAYQARQSHEVSGPYGHPTAQTERPRGSRATVALIVGAVIVALGAGGAVYGLLGGKDRTTGSSTTSPSPSHESTEGNTTADPGGQGPTTPTTPPSSATGDGEIPAAYLGTWDGSIDTGDGHNTRELVIQQGEVGDTVLSLTADGPTKERGTYHCVFQAALQSAPSGEGPVSIGPSVVTTGRPATSCTPGAATTLTLLPDGRLQRTNEDTGEQLTYTKTD